MIQGRVIRIFDRRSLVLNVGTADGVSSGMRFGIWTPREEIVDPETFDTWGRSGDERRPSSRGRLASGSR